jgi:hypothetical protein
MPVAQARGRVALNVAYQLRVFNFSIRRNTENPLYNPGVGVRKRLSLDADKGAHPSICRVDSESERLQCAGKISALSPESGLTPNTLQVER